MKRNILAGVIAAVGANMALAGEAVFYITEQGQPVDTLSVTVNGDRKLVGKNGFVSFDLGSGTHQVELSEYGQWAGEFSFDADVAENAEIQIEMIAGEAVPEIAVYTPGQEEQAVTGKVAGYIESDETGGGVQGATISISNTDIVMTTDSNGYYEIELPRGEYDFSVSHPTYGSKKLRQIRVIGNYATALNTNMSMNGNSAIEEVVAVGSYIPSTAISQQRDSSGVLDAIGAEQFARFGDSDAASALKRVTGVTVSGGKYAVVRGLNERYTSVLFNGAMLPSPDPTRRVVPLDIFPSAVISSINVEKTGSANRPSDSAGATIDILSKEAPNEFEGKFKVSAGYVDGTTFEDANVQKTSGAEVLGFGSSDRDLSEQAKNLKFQNTVTTLEGEDAANTLDLSQFQTEDITIAPDLGFELSVGDLIGNYQYGDLSYKATARYSNKWDKQELDRANYRVDSTSTGTFKESEEYVETRITNNIDLSGAFTLSLTGLEHSLISNTMLLRNTQQDSVQNKGILDEDRKFTLEKEYTWQEREFFMQQLIGDVLFPEFLDSKLDWGVTYANAKLNLPDSRSYFFDVKGSKNFQAEDDQFNPLINDRSSELELSGTPEPERNFVDLEDKAIDINLNLSMMLLAEMDYELKLKTGFSMLDRERTVEADKFVYRVAEFVPLEQKNETELSKVVIPSLFDETDAELKSKPDYNASYDGEWSYTSYYLMPEFNLYDYFRLEAGVRMEDSTLSVETLAKPGSGASTKIEVKDDNLYPSANLTVTAIEDMQFRLSYYESVNRPDFREISPAQFKDSVTGDRYIGNPNLTEAEVANIDARAEYYFSANESISIGVFQKEISNAIERTSGVVSGSGNRTVYGFNNSGDASAQGIELSGSKDFELSRFALRVSANLSMFDTEIEEINDSGFLVRKRALQGQPEVLGNVQLALDDYETGHEFTLVLNHTGESLFAIPANDGLPDEMQLARNVLDLRYKAPVSDALSLSVSLDNVLDSEVEQQQGGRLTKKYKPGREFNLSISYEF
ncbi:TonB-dependent receptor domain-containing protein [Bermanella sp. R86510]|uniref:TonB-dependent receptor n=1 Tax=unclassified Bermanella TaxID=2627862 RepID=UPI0037C5027C